MSPSSLVVRLLACVSAATCAAALAQVPPSQPHKFTTSLTGSQEFNSLQDAEAAMRAASPAAADLELRASGDEHVGNFYLRRYAKPDIRPEPELPWDSFTACGGDAQGIDGCEPNSFPTEEAALNAYENPQPGTPEECLAGREPIDAGFNSFEFWQPTLPFQESGWKRYQYTGQPPSFGCPELWWPSHVWIIAARQYECPAGYNEETAYASDYQVYCWHDLEATILEFANFDDIEKCEEKGNPCNPATEGKTQTFVDYEAPGIRFVRTWRSKVAPKYAYGGAASRLEESLALNGVPCPRRCCRGVGLTATR